MSDELASYEIFITDKADDDREKAVFRLVGIVGPDAATAWEKSLLNAVAGLPDFPGPLANAVDDTATAHFQCEVRSLLFEGPRRRKSSAAYHVLYTVLPPDTENVSIIRILRILRILHAARGAAEETPEPGADA